MLFVIADAPSVQTQRRFFNSSPFLMQAFFAATNMSSPRVRKRVYPWKEDPHPTQKLE